LTTCGLLGKGHSGDRKAAYQGKDPPPTVRAVAEEGVKEACEGSTESTGQEWIDCYGAYDDPENQGIAKIQAKLQAVAPKAEGEQSTAAEGAAEETGGKGG
jgi:hypothetical protein